jgi:ankyrin repeat protein
MADSSSSNGILVPESEKSALKAAVESDNPGVVQALLGRNNHSKEWRKVYRDLLDFAQSERVAELLVTHGADVNATSNEGTTALMDASPMPVIKYLVEKTNIILEATDAEGRTALRRAVQLDDDPEKALYLIEHTEVNAADHDGRSVLVTAIWKNRTEVLDKLLKDPDLNVNQQDEKGRSALHHLADDTTRNYEYQDGPAPHGQQKIDQDILDKLGKAGIQLGLKNYKGLTCLHLAAFKGYSGLLDVFLGSRAKDLNVDEENDRAWTPLHNVCEAAGDMLPTVNVLLHHGANPNKKTRNGRTPLHLAAGTGNLKIVERLLSRKDIKRNARDMFGNTALLSAASLNTSHQNRNDIVRLFSPWRKFHTLSEKCKKAAKLWNATIVDFESQKDDDSTANGPSSNDQENVCQSRPKKAETKNRAVGAKPLPQTSVFDLLYGRDPDDNEKPAQKVSPSDLGRDGFRWIHLPANETSWCQDLLSKYYVEEGTMDVNSFKALERSFNHQRGGKESYSRYMSSTCQYVFHCSRACLHYDMLPRARLPYANI